MKQALSGQPDYLDADAGYDSLSLMRILQRIAYNYRADQFPPFAVLMAMRNLFLTRQGDDVSDAEWYEQFKNLVIAADACGGHFAFPGIKNYVKESQFPDMAEDEITDADRKIIQRDARELSLATLYVINSNRQRYSSLKQDLENDFLKGHNNYPANMAEAQKLLINYKGLRTNQQGAQPRRQNGSNDGVSFAQGGHTTGKSEARCWKCNKKGHLAYKGKCLPEDIIAFEKLKNQDTDDRNDGASRQAVHAQCDSRTTTPKSTTAIQQFNFGLDADSFEELQAGYGVMFCQPCVVTEADNLLDRHDDGQIPTKPDVSYHNILSQSRGGKINKNWLLLDNQSTVHVICNPSFLQNIRETNKNMYIHCNAGVASTNMIGDLTGVGPVWYHPGGIANILSLSRIKRTNRVTFDSQVDNIFKVHNTDQTSYRAFRESDQGLYYSDVTAEGVTLINAVETVEQNGKRFSVLDKKRAKKARDLQDILNITTKELLTVIDNNRLPNCPVTRDDVRVADAIHGPSLVGLKGKSVRRPEEHVRVDIRPLPPDVEGKYMNVTIGADIMYVNSVRFLVTISRHIQFGTCEMIADARKETITSSLQQVSKVYSKRGFVLTNVSMDVQFEPFRNEIEGLGINANFVCRDEHVPEVERFIRTIKERTRGVQCTLPFKIYPSRLTVELVTSQVFYWNSLPKVCGISDSMSPRMIVTGLGIDYSHCRLRFGQYMQTHEETSNDTGAERTSGALALRPTGNQQGGYRFYSLSTGRVVRRNRWIKLPMPNEVVDRVHKLARRKSEGIIFLERNQQPLHEESDGASDDNSTYVPEDDEDDTDFDPAADDDSVAESTGTDGSPDPQEITGVGEDPDLEEGDTLENAGVGDPETSSEVDEPNPKRSLRPRRDRNYSHLKTVGYANLTGHEQRSDSRLKVIPILRAYAAALTTIAMTDPESDPLLWFMNETVLTQYNMRRGIKLFRERGIDAVKKEL